MSSIFHQISYAVRVLRKSPGFTISALAILTLGIGANTAIFSVVNAVLLKPLPFPNSDSVVSIYHTPPQTAFPGIATFAVSTANYLDWKKQNTAFRAMAAIGIRTFHLGGGSRPQSVLATRTEPDFFSILGIAPEAGRVFTAEENEPGHNAVAVLSHAFALNQFGSAAGALGKTLELTGTKYHVIGVMPASFNVPSWLPASTSLWVPLAWDTKDRSVRGNHNYRVVARLRDGVTIKEAQSQMTAISDRLARAYPEEDTGWGALAISLTDDLVGDVRPALLVLLGAVGFVLLIACANTANLVLVRTIARRKELAIRAALGANASQALLPVLIETTLLSVTGGAIGLLFASTMQKLVIGAFADQMPRATEVQLDGRVLAFTLVASILTGVASGLIACWRLLKVDLHDSLKQGLGKTDAYASGRNTRSILVAAEVALSLILLVGAGLMVRSLWALRGTSPGFDASNVTTLTIPIPAASGAAMRSRFYSDILPQVRALPEVDSAAAVDTLPVSGGGSEQPIVIEGRPAEVFALQPNVAVRVATPGYLQTMRIPLIAGRDFNERDTLGKPATVLISQSMARQFWPGESPLGKRLRISFTPEISREVIGVVGDVKDRGLDFVRPISMLYMPLEQTASGHYSLAVRTNRNAPGLVAEVTAILQKVDPELPVRDVISLDDLLSTSLAQHRFSMFLFAALAGLAVLLAAVGIYSVLAYNVRRRVQEISIRMAMGAQVADILRLVVTEGMKPALIGLAAGAVGAYALSGILAQLIYGVSTTDPYTFCAVALLLLAVAMVACVIPAYRATRVEPVKALRNE